MGTKISFNNITASFQSADAMNAIFDLIEGEFDKCLYRDGTSPNQMTADLDMNSNDILNVGTISVDDILVDGQALGVSVLAAATSASDSADSAAASAASAAEAAASALAAATNASFLGLDDTPATYVGQSGKFLTVNVGETALEFSTSTGSEPSDGDKGDITVSSSGAVWTIDDGIAVTSWNLTTPTITTNFTFDSVIVTGLTGVDVSLVSGTAGTASNLAMWNADGDVVDSTFSVIDEDSFASDSAVKVPTQQSVKAYVDAQVATTSDVFGSALLHLQDQQASGASGGTFTSGAWRTRTLNSVLTNEITGASLATNQITLPAGTYWIEAEAPGHRVDPHKAKLYNVTDASDTLIGSSADSGGDASFVQTYSTIKGRFTIAAPKVFEIRHRCTSTRSTNGLGSASSFGVNEIYSDLRIWKIA